MDKEEKQKLATEKERIEKRKTELRKILREAPKETVQFMSLQNPPDPDLTFSWEGIRTYYLVHNGVYTLPVPVIEHLREKKIPIYEQYDPNPDPSVTKTEPSKVEDRITGYQPRFALNPVSFPKQAPKAAKKTEKEGGAK